MTPHFSAHVYYGKTAGWIKTALGMELGLIPGDFVLDGDPVLPSQKLGRAPLSNFRPISIVAKRLHATWYGGRPQPRGLCVRWGPSPPKFSAHVYYRYCDFVRTWHRRYWFVQVQVVVRYSYAFHF